MKALVTSVALAVTAAASALAQQPHASNEDRPPEFSCTGGQPLDFTKEELEQKAFEEIERKGGKLPAHYSVTLKRWGCDWWVFVLQQPSVPGADFGVRVDGISGAVKQYVRR